MVDLNTLIHEVCEHERTAMTHIFSFKPGSFQFQLGMDQNGYIYQILSSPPRLINPGVSSPRPEKGQQLVGTFQSSIMTEFSARLIGALGNEIARYDPNCEVAVWLKAKLKSFLFQQRGVVGTIAHHWKKRKVKGRE